METECCRAGTIVKEDFRVLVRCAVEIQVPQENPAALSFYQKTAEAAVRWCMEVLGERAKREYAVLSDLWAKARFLPYRYALQGKVVFEDAAYFALVCESTFSHGNERRIRHAAQVWNKREGSVLPLRQVLRLFGGQKIPKEKGFRPDGAYPENGKLILFQNANSKLPFAERELQIFEKQK